MKYRIIKHNHLNLLDMVAGDTLEAGEAQGILDALKLAETRVLETLRAMTPEEVTR